MDKDAVLSVKFPKWFDCKIHKKCVDEWRERFKRYKATILMNDDHYLILDWQSALQGDGKDKSTLNKHFRYILDKDMGRFMMEESEGSTIVLETRVGMTLKSFMDIFCHTEEFFNLLETALGNVRDFDYLKALVDLQEEKYEAETVYGEGVDALADVDEDFDAMLDILSEYGKDVIFHGRFLTLWQKYHDIYNGPDRLGSTWTENVYVFSLGFLMACEGTGLIRVSE